MRKHESDQGLKQTLTTCATSRNVVTTLYWQKSPWKNSVNTDFEKRRPIETCCQLEVFAANIWQSWSKELFLPPARLVLGTPPAALFHSDCLKSYDLFTLPRISLLVYVRSSEDSADSCKSWRLLPWVVWTKWRQDFEGSYTSISGDHLYLYISSLTCGMPLNNDGDERWLLVYWKHIVCPGEIIVQTMWIRAICIPIEPTKEALGTPNCSRLPAHRQH